MKALKNPASFLGAGGLIGGIIASTWSTILLVALTARGFAGATGAGLMTAVGGTAMLIPALWGGFPRQVVRSGRVWKSIAVIGAATVAINYFFGIASVLVALAVVTAGETAGQLMTPALIEWRKGPKVFVWPILALLGVVLLVRPWEGAWNLKGVVFSVLVGAGMALRIVVTKRIGGGAEDALTDERLSFFESVFARGVGALVGGLLLVPVAILSGETNHPQLSGWVILLVVVAGLANTAIPTLAEVVAVRVKLDPVTISTMYAFTAVVALVFTCAGQHRWPTLVEFGAAALVVVGAAGAASIDRDASAVPSERENSIEADTPPGQNVSRASAPLRGARGRRRGMKRPPSWAKERAKAQGRGNKKKNKKKNKNNARRHRR